MTSIPVSEFTDYDGDVWRRGPEGSWICHDQVTGRAFWYMPVETERVRFMYAEREQKGQS
jgi:hypothetical protein